MEKIYKNIMIELSKGSDQRPMNVPKDQFEKNFERIFLVGGGEAASIFMIER